MRDEPGHPILPEAGQQQPHVRRHKDCLMLCAEAQYPRGIYENRAARRPMYWRVAPSYPGEIIVNFEIWGLGHATPLAQSCQFYSGVEEEMKGERREERG